MKQSNVNCPCCWFKKSFLPLIDLCLLGKECDLLAVFFQCPKLFRILAVILLSVRLLKSYWYHHVQDCHFPFFPPPPCYNSPALTLIQDLVFSLVHSGVQISHLARSWMMESFKAVCLRDYLFFPKYAAVVWCLQACIAVLKPHKNTSKWTLFKIIWQVIILLKVKCLYDKLIQLDLCAEHLWKLTVYLIFLPPKFDINQCGSLKRKE